MNKQLVRYVQVEMYEQVAVHTCNFYEVMLLLLLSLIHISEPTRLGMISYAVFCLKKKKKDW